MEKLTWVKPEMEEVRFAANEYIASCGESNSVYRFICDAAAGLLYMFWENLFSNVRVEEDYDPGKIPDMLNNYSPSEVPISYTPCEKEHEASTSSDFYWGFIDSEQGGTRGSYDSGIDQTVIVWKETFTGPLTGIEYPYNWHATTNLNKATWETTRS